MLRHICCKQFDAQVCRTECVRACSVWWTHRVCAIRAREGLKASCSDRGCTCCRAPEDCPQAVVDLWYECVDPDPAKRPTAAQIVSRLEPVVAHRLHTKAQSA